ncbi:DUF2605 domain-containing protein [Calothrix sp. NIES-2098]|uniref:DUF2605 domain-containing protein n=1 Tax=Calothrix sp. NIES-2098 TaxID=1954171 RepID=UPI000B5EA393|nr:hypothetical protein NIES2098_65120 [Calothrix sp. NIES-2098]
MQDSNSSGAELLKSLLEPLLEDFQFWFAGSRQFLESRQLSFMSEEEQNDLLLQVKQAQDELNTAKMMFNATDGQVGIDMATITPWHELVTECWNVVMRYHQEKDI